MLINIFVLLYVYYATMGIGRRTVYRLLERGEIKAGKTGTITITPCPEVNILFIK